MIDIQAMFPVMVSNELEALKNFYESVFGFQTVFYDAEFYLHLLSPNTGIQLGFLVPEHASQPSMLHTAMVQEGYVISFEVKDAAQAYSQAQELKLNISMALKQEVWGQTHFIVQDPAGFYIDVVEHVQQAPKP